MNFRSNAGFCLFRHFSSVRRFQRTHIEEISTLIFRDRCREFKKVHFDLGTGDAKFIYRLAKKDPETLFVGIDSNADSMGHIAWKVKSKVSRGGLAVQNLELLHMPVEEIPDEFSNLADCVTINYPWGSLLRRITEPDLKMAKTISKISRIASQVHLHLNFTLYSNKTLIHRLKVQDLSERAALEAVKRCFSRYQLYLVEQSLEDSSRTRTTWGQHLALSSGRQVLTLRFLKE